MRFKVGYTTDAYYRMTGESENSAWCQKRQLSGLCVGDELCVAEGDYNIEKDPNNGRWLFTRLVPSEYVLYNVILVARVKCSDGWYGFEIEGSTLECRLMSSGTIYAELSKGKEIMEYDRMCMNRVKLSSESGWLLVTRIDPACAPNSRCLERENIHMKATHSEPGGYLRLECTSNSRRCCYFNPLELLGVRHFDIGEEIHFSTLCVAEEFLPRLGNVRVVQNRSVIQSCPTALCKLEFNKHLTLESSLRDTLILTDEGRQYTIDAVDLQEILNTEKFTVGEHLTFFMLEIDENNTIFDGVGFKKDEDVAANKGKAIKIRDNLNSLLGRSGDFLEDLKPDHLFWEVLRPTMRILCFVTSQNSERCDLFFDVLCNAVEHLAREKMTILKNVGLSEREKNAATVAGGVVYTALHGANLLTRHMNTLDKKGLDTLSQEVKEPQPVSVQHCSAQILAHHKKEMREQRKEDLKQCIPLRDFIDAHEVAPSSGEWEISGES